jgi:hypothetical protein
VSEERPRWLLKILLVVIALGGLGWAIWRYSNTEPVEGPDNSPTPEGTKPGPPPSAPKLPPIKNDKGPGNPKLGPNG